MYLSFFFYNSKVESICHLHFSRLNLFNITAINMVFFEIVSVFCRDMSNNSFDESDFPPWILSLESLTTL